MHLPPPTMILSTVTTTRRAAVVCMRLERVTGVLACAVAAVGLQGSAPRRAREGRGTHPFS